MATDLTEVELQVLSAVRDEGVPTTDVEVVQRTGLTAPAIREALLSLGEDHLLIEERGADPLQGGIRVVDFKGDGVVPRPPTKDWEE